MKIKIIEKVILTEEEMNTLNDACYVIEELYRISPSNSELDKQLGELLTSLSDLIDNVEVVIDND